MALQAWDEENDLQNTHEYRRLEISQYSQNKIYKPVTTLNFSSVIDTVNELPSHLKDPNGVENDCSIFPDEVDKVDKIMNDAQSEIEKMSPDELLDHLMQELDLVELKKIDQSIEDRTMTVENEPPIDIRRRYKTDGKRQIEKSRSKPMAVGLPNLKNCKLNPNLSFWLQLDLLTTDKNPSGKVYIHPDEIEYHEGDLPKCDDGLARVLLTYENIQNGIKELPRVSIIKKKLSEYTFELKPFEPSVTNNTTEIDENTNREGIVAKAKIFRSVYNLNLSRIACKLLIKQNETWYTTDIKCETDIMREKEKQPKKRSSTSYINDDNDEYQVPCRSPAKKRKRSPTLIKGLPITRVKNLPINGVLQ